MSLGDPLVLGGVAACTIFEAKLQGERDRVVGASSSHVVLEHEIFEVVNVAGRGSFDDLPIVLRVLGTAGRDGPHLDAVALVHEQIADDVDEQRRRDGLRRNAAPTVWPLRSCMTNHP